MVLTSGRAKQVQNSVHVAINSRKFIVMCSFFCAIGGGVGNLCARERKREKEQNENSWMKPLIIFIPIYAYEWKLCDHRQNKSTILRSAIQQINKQMHYYANVISRYNLIFIICWKCRAKNFERQSVFIIFEQLHVGGRECCDKAKVVLLLNCVARR